MPLKYVIKKDQASEIPEAFKAHYVERNGDFYLDVEGVVSADVHREFRDGNIAIARALGVKNNAEALARIEAIKDFDPATITAEREELTNFRAGKAPKLEEMLATRTDAMKKDFEKKLKDKTDSESALSQKLAKVLIDDALATAAAEKGVLPAALSDVKLRGRGVFKLEGDNVVAYDEAGRQIFGKDSQPIKMGEWMETLAATAGHLFSANRGGGGGGGGNGGTGFAGKNPFSKKSLNLTLQATLEREQPALAARLKQQAASE